MITIFVIISEFFNGIGLKCFAGKHISFIFTNITTLDDLKDYKEVFREAIILNKLGRNIVNKSI